ncbi:MAG: HD domain-containing protein [Clostridia bacterium]|nr:HD domain-containing protein [Clostridia bacterium]
MGERVGIGHVFSLGAIQNGVTKHDKESLTENKEKISMGAFYAIISVRGDDAVKISDRFYEIAEKVAKNNGRMYLVGGAVRDAQLGKEPHDMDFCVTGLSTEEFMELFDAPRIQGKSFPVFIIDGCEFALARKERKIGAKHTDFEVQTDKAITIEEDLARRDLTINSMAMDVLTGKLVDPFHGLQDLKEKKIRMTTEAYSEDPLRVYRTARFAAKFGFDVEEHTLKTMESMREELVNLPNERVTAEFRKALMTEHPSMFFDTLRKANILDVHFPEVANLIGVEQPVLYHPEGDAYVHTLEVLDRAVQATPSGIRFKGRVSDVSAKLSLQKPSPQKAEASVVQGDNAKHTRFQLKRLDESHGDKNARDEQREMIRFCALVHDFGKAATPREEWPHHYNHEENGVPIIQEFCKRMNGIPKKFEKAGKLTSMLHMKAGRYDNLKPATKVKIFSEIEQSRSLSYEGLEIVASCDSKAPVHFAKTAREVMQIKVTPEIKDRCTVDGVFDYEKAKGIILQKRIEEVKRLEGKKEKEAPKGIASVGKITLEEIKRSIEKEQENEKNK